MWDLIVSVPDHCLSFYFAYVDVFKDDKRNIFAKNIWVHWSHKLSIKVN